jgi:hypothetical protein
VGVLALREAEGCLQILVDVLRLLHCSKDDLVDLLLIRCLRLRERLLRLGLALLEKLRLGVAGTLGTGLREVCVVELGVNLESVASREISGVAT